MPDALRTAVPSGDWRSFPFTCALSGGMEGIRTAVNADAIGARRSSLYLINETVAMILEDVAFGGEGLAIYEAEKILVPKETGSGEVFLPGDAVYFDLATRLVSPTQGSGDLWIGIAVEPAGISDLRVEIDLHGNHATE